MTDCNAYFKVSIVPDGVSLVLFPKTGTGKDLDYREIEEYLVNRNFLSQSYTLS